MLAPIKCFEEKDRWLWRILDRGFKAFALSGLLFTMLAIEAAILDIPITPPK
jgi:hypothetical protein